MSRKKKELTLDQEITYNACKRCLKSQVRVESNGDKVIECSAFKNLQSNCPGMITDYATYIKQLEQMIEYNRAKFNSNTAHELSQELKRVKKKQTQELKSLYLEDVHRGSGGGGSDQKNNSAGIKAKMKDNRILETKPKQKDKDEYNQAVKDFEEQHGKLDKLRPNFGLTRDKIDSYTGDDI